MIRLAAAGLFAIGFLFGAPAAGVLAHAEHAGHATGTERAHEVVPEHNHTAHERIPYDPPPQR